MADATGFARCDVGGAEGKTHEATRDTFDLMLVGGLGGLWTTQKPEGLDDPRLRKGYGALVALSAHSD